MAIFNQAIPASPQRTPPLGAGGGIATPRQPAFDPSGLVPVNRVQPLAGSQSEIQRLTESRLGTMPPSSFAGAGAGFVPTNGNTGIVPPSMGGSPVPAMAHPAVFQSDAGFGHQMTAPPPPVSAPAMAQVQNQHSLFGGQPSPTFSDPRAPQAMIDHQADRLARQQAQRQTMLANLQQRLPPATFAALQQRLAENDARRAQFANQPPQSAASRVDFVRQQLANPPQPVGLLGRPVR